MTGVSRRLRCRPGFGFGGFRLGCGVSWCSTCWSSTKKGCRKKEVLGGGKARKGGAGD